MNKTRTSFDLQSETNCESQYTSTQRLESKKITMSIINEKQTKANNYNDSGDQTNKQIKLIKQFQTSLIALLNRFL